MRLYEEEEANTPDEEEEENLLMDIIITENTNKRLYNPEGSLLVGDEEWMRETKRIKRYHY